MGNIGQYIGLSGLAKGIDRRANRQENLLALEKLNSLNEQQKQKELQVQQMQAQQMQYITEQADKLLGPDREKINELSREMQSKIKRQVGLSGSKAAFWDNNGYEIINEYKNSILNSKELGVYRENRTNFEKLQRIISTPGYKKYVTQKDLRSLENYEKNGGGMITYSGMLNDIELPVQNFAIGQDVSADAIIGNKDNRMKLLADFHTEHPDLPIPTKEIDIKNTLTAYLKERGLTGIVGANAKLAIANQKAVREAKLKANKQQLATAVVQHLENINANGIDYTNNDLEKQTENDVFFNSTFGGGKYNKGGKDNTFFKSIGSVAMNHTPFAVINNLFSDKLFSTNFGLDDYYTPKAGAIISISPEVGVKTVLGRTAVIVNNKFTGDVSSGPGRTFNSKGVELLNETKEGEWNVGKTIRAFGGLNKDNAHFISMNETDEDGKVIKAVRLTDDKDNPRVYAGYYQTFYNSDTSEVIYKQIDLENKAQRNNFTTYLKESKENDLTDVTISDQKVVSNLKSGKTKASATLKAQQDALDKQSRKLTYPKETTTAFDSTLYKMQSKNYANVPERNNLVKAFYMATSSRKSLNEAIGKNLFKLVTERMEATSFVNDKSKNNDWFIKQWTNISIRDSKVDGDYTELEKAKIEKFTKDWRAYLNKITKDL